VILDIDTRPTSRRDNVIVQEIMTT